MTRGSRRTRRILIALDPAAPRRDPFEPVAALGRAHGAELTGLFVEDANLLRLATLPFAQEIRPGPDPDAPRSIDRAQIEAQLRTRAEEVRRAFEEGAAHLRMRYRFNVRRGDVLDELAAAAHEAEMLVIGRSVRSAGARTWLGVRFDRLAQAAERAGVSLVFVREPWASGSRVLTLWDASEGAVRALETANAFADAERLALTVAVVGDDAASRDRHATELQRHLDQMADETTDEMADKLTTDAEVRDAGALEAGLLRALCTETDARVLILPSELARESRLALGELLTHLPTSLVLQH